MHSHTNEWLYGTRNNGRNKYLNKEISIRQQQNKYTENQKKLENLEARVKIETKQTNVYA
jgi:hypothetical protein